MSNRHKGCESSNLLKVKNMSAKGENPNQQQVTVLFVAVDMVGILNPLIAVAEQLVATGGGHRAVFALERAWASQISSQYAGIEEVLYTDPKRDPALKAKQFWTETIKMVENTFPLEGVAKVSAANPAFRIELFDALLRVDDQLAEIIEKKVKPDVIVVDAFVTVPAVWHSGRPWVRAFSTAPLRIASSPLLPPHSSGMKLQVF